MRTRFDYSYIILPFKIVATKYIGLLGVLLLRTPTYIFIRRLVCMYSYYILPTYFLCARDRRVFGVWNTTYMDYIILLLQYIIFCTNTHTLS